MRNEPRIESTDGGSRYSHALLILDDDGDQLLQAVENAGINNPQRKATFAQDLFWPRTSYPLPLPVAPRQPSLIDALPDPSSLQKLTTSSPALHSIVAAYVPRTLLVTLTSTWTPLPASH